MQQMSMVITVEVPDDASTHDVQDVIAWKLLDESKLTTSDIIDPSTVKCVAVHNPVIDQR